MTYGWTDPRALADGMLAAMPTDPRRLTAEERHEIDDLRAWLAEAADDCRAIQLAADMRERAGLPTRDMGDYLAELAVYIEGAQAAAASLLNYLEPPHTAPGARAWGVNVHAGGETAEGAARGARNSGNRGVA